MTAPRLPSRRLPASPPRPRTPDERLARSGALRAWLAADLPLCVADWPEEAQYAFEERAGICEYDGHLPREEAEKLAERCVRAEAARVSIPPDGDPP